MGDSLDGREDRLESGKLLQPIAQRHPGFGDMVTAWAVCKLAQEVAARHDSDDL